MIFMAKKTGATQSGTNIQEVRQQNAQASQGQQFGTEFASETNASEVRKQNQQAEARKSQNTSK